MKNRVIASVTLCAALLFSGPASAQTADNCAAPLASGSATQTSGAALTIANGPKQYLLPACFANQTPLNMHTYTYKTGLANAPGGLKVHVLYPPGFMGTHPLPVVAIFHGGGWSSGNPLYWLAGARYLASRGAAVALFQYRLRSVNGATTQDSVKDALSAIRWLRKNAATLSVHKDRILAVGDSAGGHLAIMTGSGTSLSDEKGADARFSPEPYGVVAFYPVLDTTSTEYVCWRGRKDPDVSPVKLMSSGDNPHMLIIQGDNDIQPLLNPNGAKPVATAQKFCGVKNDVVKGTRCWVQVIPGAPHSFMDNFTGDVAGQGINYTYRMGMTFLDQFMGDLNMLGFANAKTLPFDQRLAYIKTAATQGPAGTQDCSTNNIQRYWDFTHALGYPLSNAFCTKGYTTANGTVCTGKN